MPADFGAFDPVCAPLPGDDEEAVWRRFLDRVECLDAQGDYAVYVYSHHERGTLSRLAGQYGGSVALDSFMDRFVDLEAVVRERVVSLTDSRGLKSLARFVGFDWRDDDPSGAQSMVWWSEYFG